MIDTIYSDPNFLQHYGVKGMKWGVRRYQNADGTRTTLGKTRERLQNVDKKRAVKHAAATAVTVGGIVYTAKNLEEVENLISSGVVVAGKTLSNAIRSGANDAAKILVTGGLIYAGEKLIESEEGRETANKIIQYGRQPQKKK